MTDRCECKRHNRGISLRDCTYDALVDLAEPRRLMGVTPSRLNDLFDAFTMRSLSSGLVTLETLITDLTDLHVERYRKPELSIEYFHDLAEFRRANDYDLITAIKQSSAEGLRLLRHYHYRDMARYVVEQEGEAEDRGKRRA